MSKKKKKKKKILREIHIRDDKFNENKDDKRSIASFSRSDSKINEELFHKN